MMVPRSPVRASYVDVAAALEGGGGRQVSLDLMADSLYAEGEG